MLKKRIIFTLLYDSGDFMLSRNFRLQRVGNVDWLFRNYNFQHITFFIDELVVLDVTRGERDSKLFCETLKVIAANCFVPIAAGGGIRNVSHAQGLLRSGADKIVLNSPLFDSSNLVRELTQEFGQQCIVGSVDIKREEDGFYQIYINNGSQPIERRSLAEMPWFNEQLVGELYLNSINQDGTGQGYDFAALDQLPTDLSIPVIMAGGVGNTSHLSEGLADARVDAVSTAHLFNFVGDGLQRARENLVSQGASLAVWPPLGPMGRTAAHSP